MVVIAMLVSWCFSWLLAIISTSSEIPFLWTSKTDIQTNEGSSLYRVKIDKSITILGFTSLANVIGGVLVLLIGPNRN